MSAIHTFQSWLHTIPLPALITVGIMTFAGFYAGKSMKYIHLPSIIGFMFVGVILGPSLLNLLDEGLQHHLGFITEVALGFVAVTIGLELDLHSLKKQGSSIVVIIIMESFLAFIITTLGVYFFTKNLPLALIFGSIAPASAPAGTVAVIQEYKASGSLTKALYAVVGFDDGLGIIIFGFAAAISRSLLASEVSGGEEISILASLIPPLKEVFISVGIGTLSSFIFCLLARRLSSAKDIFILMFSFVLILVGLSNAFHLSLILTNMVFGLVTVNTQSHTFIKKIGDEVTRIMPLLFVLFFVLAGANLHVAALPALGMLGVVYVLCRTTGLMGGAWFGSVIGGANENIRRYLGMGILSQAGVAIGLALIVKHEFSVFGEAGKYIGATVITTVTATCIFFEIIGPILTKIALTKAGEINTSSQD